MATRTDSAHRIREELNWLGCRQIVCAAFGYEDLAVETLDILNGHLTSPNLGGYCATSRVPLVWVGPVGCYYQDPAGHYWSSVDLGGCRQQPCDLCGRETRG